MNDTKLTSIIIPTHNGLHLLSSCIESIRRHTEMPYEIIVVDNGSTDGTQEYCSQAGLTFIALPRNEGFPAACNRGLAIASGEQLLLLNNDVIVTPRWLSNMLRALYSADDIGIVGPVSNYASGRQQVDMVWNTLEEFMQIAERYNQTDPAKWQDVNRLVGLCFLFRRKLWDIVGRFDERFSPGHYEDDDYCYRARKKAFRLLISGDTLIYHGGSASFAAKNPDGWKSLLELNRQKFIDKWGIDPWIYL
ncbi:glycosyltransferase family 2 protein [Paenibacillus bouchesdurhonensis]|uniref:glycosyltransferase family 2 protein n=1 Tax=Paenibacillus bouchesdurhonensis TaxID=1870990 RepID=UPI000DA63706|nr:glycosyltransferase family 2 protein [Paenibacillus bouchesdurhonensis]